MSGVAICAPSSRFSPKWGDHAENLFQRGCVTRAGSPFHWRGDKYDLASSIPNTGHFCRVAVCHDKFDFAGLVFEGYGPIGERRSHDLGGKPVDDSTEFPGGTAGKGLAGLQAYLLKHRHEQFIDNFSRKLLAYGLGRSLLLTDEPTINRMKQNLAEK